MLVQLGIETVVSLGTDARVTEHVVLLEGF